MTTVRAGERGVDFSFARPPAARLLELGYTFVVGYISVPPSAPAKNITKAECEAYVAAGLKVLLVWEQTASCANLGAPYGTSDGTHAARLALAHGYPVDVPILVADDTNTTAVNIDQHEAYVRAFANACNPYPVGIYGDTDILGRCVGLWRIGWLPNAWSWSGASRADAEAKAKAIGAHVLQRKGFYIDDVWAVDPNDAIADFPAWGLFPDPQPVPEDDDMRIATNEETRTMPYGEAPPRTAIFVVGTRKRNIGAEEYNDLYANIPAMPLKNATLDQIPDEAGEGSATTDPATEARIARLEVVSVQLNDSVGRLGQNQAGAAHELEQAATALKGGG